MHTKYENRKKCLFNACLLHKITSLEVKEPEDIPFSHLNLNIFFLKIEVFFLNTSIKSVAIIYHDSLFKINSSSRINVAINDVSVKRRSIPLAGVCRNHIKVGHQQVWRQTCVCSFDGVQETEVGYNFMLNKRWFVKFWICWK